MYAPGQLVILRQHIAKTCKMQWYSERRWWIIRDADQRPNPGGKKDIPAYKCRNEQGDTAIWLWTEIRLPCQPDPTR